MEEEVNDPETYRKDLSQKTKGVQSEERPLLCSGHCRTTVAHYCPFRSATSQGVEEPLSTSMPSWPLRDPVLHEDTAEGSVDSAITTAALQAHVRPPPPRYINST